MYQLDPITLARTTHGTTGLARIAQYQRLISSTIRAITTAHEPSVDDTLDATATVLHLYRAIDLDPACKGR